MSWDSAAERLPRRRLGGSAAAAPLRPPRLPGRPTSARQRRHLDTGWAGRAATGHREGHGMRCACAGRRGEPAASAWCAATGRREGQGGPAARSVRMPGAARGVWDQPGHLSTPPRLDSLFTPPPQSRGLDPYRTHHFPADLATRPPGVRSPRARQSRKNVYLRNKASGFGPDHFFFLAALSLPSMSRWACLLIPGRDGTEPLSTSANRKVSG